MSQMGRTGSVLVAETLEFSLQVFVGHGSS